VELLLLRARALSAQRDWEPAIQAYRRAEMANGGTLPPLDALQLSQALYRAGREQGGRVYLEATLAQAQPAPLEAVLLFAREEGSRQPQRAHELLRAAAAEHPGDMRVLTLLTQLELALGQADTAMRRLDEAIQQSPDAAGLLFLRARLKVAQNQLPAATADMRAALEQRPDLPNGVDFLVRLLAAQGQVEQARAELDAQEKAGTLRPSSQLLLARLHLSPGGDEDRGIALLEKILATRSDAPGVKNDLAFLLAKRGTDLERARRLAEEARAAMSDNAQVADTLGYVYLKSNLPEAALDQFRAAIEGAENNQPEWSTFHYHLGLALKALGRDAEATQAFERALASAVEFPEAEDTRRELVALREARAQ
jgi:predicted Zn-dependent protease